MKIEISIEFRILLYIANVYKLFIWQNCFDVLLFFGL